MHALTASRVAVSGDYLLTGESPAAIQVADGVSARLFESGDVAGAVRREVSLGSGATCDVVAAVRSPADWSLRTSQAGAGSTLRVRVALAARGGGALVARVACAVGGEGNSADAKILSLVADGASVDLDGTMSVLPGARRAKAHIFQENVFLDGTGTVRGVPGLTVASDGVQAGHCARTQRLSDERLFYLRSRGIAKDAARAMMLRDAVHGLFSGLDETLLASYADGALGFALGAA